MELGKEIWNSESNIYHYFLKKEHRILKVLWNREEKYFANKIYTCKLLDAYQEYLPKSLITPDLLAICNKDIIGFSAPFLEGINLSTILKSSKIDFKEQIYYLRKIGQLLEQLRQIRKYTPLTDFYLNDLHEFNFMIDPIIKKLYVVDLDSAKIKDNDICPSRYALPHSLMQYVPSKYKVNEHGHCGGYIIPDDNSEIYCYIMTILNYMFGSSCVHMKLLDFYEYLNYFEWLGIDKEFISVIRKIVEPGGNINPEPYLETLSLTQISRSRENVYKIVKKRKTH